MLFVLGSFRWFRLEAAEFATVLCLSAGASSVDANAGCGGTVYLRCTLSPIICCDGDETIDAAAQVRHLKKLTASTEVQTYLITW